MNSSSYPIEEGMGEGRRKKTMLFKQPWRSDTGRPVSKWCGCGGFRKRVRKREYQKKHTWILREKRGKRKR